VTWTVRICNWREFQHYKDRDPPWIKLHQRKLLDKPAWRKLHGSAAKLLVDLWMLAAGTKEGELTSSLADLAYRLRADDTEVLADLKVLSRFEFIELDTLMLANASVVQADAAPEGEGEAEQRERTDATHPGSARKDVSWLMGVLRDTGYYPDKKPPEGYDDGRDAGILGKLLGRYAADDLADALRGIRAVADRKLSLPEGSTPWLKPLEKFTARWLVNQRWGNRPLLDYARDVWRKGAPRTDKGTGMSRIQVSAEGHLPRDRSVRT